MSFNVVFGLMIAGVILATILFVETSRDDALNIRKIAGRVRNIRHETRGFQAFVLLLIALYALIFVAPFIARS